MSQKAKKRHIENDTHFRSEEFLQLIRTRNPEAVTTLVRTYTEHLYRGALGLGFEHNLAKDLVQNVWITFFDVLPKFKAQSHVKTFIFGILYNKASELRREQVRFDSKDPVEEVLEKHFDSTGSWASPPIDPERFMVASQTMVLIEKCLESLPLTQRMAFCLREIDDHGSSDICKILGVTITNLGVLLFRAKNRLRECIEGKAKA